MSWYQELSRIPSVDETIDDLAKETANNHNKFKCFAWFDRPEDHENFAIFYTHNRDSGLLELSNASEIEKLLGKEEFEEDIRFESHMHFAVGYVDGFAIRCLNKDGTATKAFHCLVEIANRLNNYPVLNEEDYSEREWHATLENIGNNGCQLLDDPPDGWEGMVLNWLWENNQSAVENVDDQGGYPSKDEIKEALIALKLLEEENDSA